jgi:cyclophilin family peptidyl-prolyl cis-trans isomerase
MLHKRWVICIATVTFLLSSCAKPVAMLAIDDSRHVAPKIIQFKNKSLKAESYLWNFGDGTTSSEFAPSHRYNASGRYTITLTATKGKKNHTYATAINVDAPTDCLVEMQTNYGTMVVKLYDQTPKHRDNFLKLVQSSYYEGILFHRVISGFMIQAGDPDSKSATKESRLGGGGPGYTIPAEMVEGLVHTKGALAAARLADAANPDKSSSGSQFYIVQGRPVPEEQLNFYEIQKSIKYTKEQRKIMNTLGGTPQLDKEYTVFGHVIEGLDIIDKIASTNTDGSDRPLNDIKINKLQIIK